MKHNDLMFFVHVPKTAGSTINYCLDWSYAKGYAHCENFINKRQMLTERVAQVDWLSGHVTYPSIKELLSEITNRHIRYFSCMRDPKAQVISHFNWLIEIGHRTPEFFYGHPLNIQDISFEIRASDLSKKHTIMHLLLKYRGLFLNNQARFILGEKLENDCAFIQNVINQYERIGTSKNVSRLLNKMGVRLQEGPSKKNVSRYHFDVGLFDDEEVEHFLRVHNGVDNRLYAMIDR